MNTPYGMMMVITTSATAASAMQAMQSHSIACRYSLFKLFRVQDALLQPGVLGAVLVADRLGGLEEGFLVRGDELHARRLQLRLGFGGVLVPALALLHLRISDLM